jgi:hypothetical protein
VTRQNCEILAYESDKDIREREREREKERDKSEN